MAQGRQQEAVCEDGRRKSDLSRAFSEDGARKTHVGGQALIEGIMMRGKYNWSVAVREPSGSVYVEEHDLASGRGKNGWMHWPLVRGCRALVESLVLGYKALEIATLHAYGEGDAADAAAEDGAARSGAVGEGGRAASDAEGGNARTASADEGGRGADARRLAADGRERAFSWRDDFGRPDTMIDALGAQRALEVADPPSFQEGEPGSGEGGLSAPGDADPLGPARPAASASGDAEGPASASRAPSAPAEDGFGKKEMALSMVMGVVLGVALFIAAPALITNLIVGEYDGNTLLWNIVDGLLRVAVFVFYLWLVGRMKEIKRMFGYHGAEHKTIHCYEHGLPLTPENARRFPRLHVRCGTAFLIMVMVIAIFVYTVTPLNGLIEAWGVPDGAPKLLLVIAARILLMPVIAGVSYEITVRWAGSRPENPLVKVVLWPGMQMQYLTTNEPDDGMLECAIAAMERVLAREEAEAAASESKAKARSAAEAAA